MTHAEAMDEIIGLRGGSLPEKQYRKWRARIEEYYPEDVAKAANRVADSWLQSSPWPIGVLTTELKKFAAINDPEPETLRCFTWSPDGQVRGDWSIFDRLPDAEREEIAMHLLRTGSGIDHENLAERMAQGSCQRYREAKALSDKRREVMDV